MVVAIHASSCHRSLPGRSRDVLSREAERKNWRVRAEGGSLIASQAVVVATEARGKSIRSPAIIVSAGPSAPGRSA